MGRNSEMFILANSRAFFDKVTIVLSRLLFVHQHIQKIKTLTFLFKRKVYYLVCSIEYSKQDTHIKQALWYADDVVNVTLVAIQLIYGAFEFVSLYFCLQYISMNLPK